MDDALVKFCKDCKWYRDRHGYCVCPSLPWNKDEIERFTDQTKPAEEFFVTGKNKKPPISWYYATGARKLEQQCGKSGKFFTQKPKRKWWEFWL